MYQCSVCQKETKDTSKKCCPNSTFFALMSASMAGKGGLNAKTEEKNNNLEESSALVIKQMMSMVIGVEFFHGNKEEIFAKDVVIEDSETKRKFTFNLSAKEI